MEMNWEGYQEGFVRGPLDTSLLVD